MKEIKTILSQPSKSNAMVSIIVQCLPTGKLEDASLACLYEDSCSDCGFHILWSNGLRQTLFDDEGDLQLDEKLHCELELKLLF